MNNEQPVRLMFYSWLKQYPLIGDDGYRADRARQFAATSRTLNTAWLTAGSIRDEALRETVYVELRALEQPQQLELEVTA